MTPMLIALSYWLHVLATVVFIGYFVLLAVLCLPVLVDNPAALSAISKRSYWWMKRFKYGTIKWFSRSDLYQASTDPQKGHV